MHKLYTSLFSSGKLLPTRYAPLELEISLNSTVSDWLVASGSTSSSLQHFKHTVALRRLHFGRSRPRILLQSPPCQSRFEHPHDDCVPGGAIDPQWIHVVLLQRSAGVLSSFSRLAHLQEQWPEVFFFHLPHDHGWIWHHSHTLGWSLPCSKVVDRTSPMARSTGSRIWFRWHSRALLHVPEGSAGNSLHHARPVSDRKLLHHRLRCSQDAIRSYVSAISTRSGDLLRVDLTNLTANVATECWMTLFAFSVTAIRESGVTLLVTLMALS